MAREYVIQHIQNTLVATVRGILVTETPITVAQASAMDSGKDRFSVRTLKIRAATKTVEKKETHVKGEQTRMMLVQRVFGSSR